MGQMRNKYMVFVGKHEGIESVEYPRNLWIRIISNLVKRYVGRV
jgi:hypothetical protein